MTAASRIEADELVPIIKGVFHELKPLNSASAVTVKVNNHIFCLLLFFFEYWGVKFILFIVKNSKVESFKDFFLENKDRGP